MSLANCMGASFHFTNYGAEVREQTIFRAATAEAPELIFDTGASTSLINNKCMLSNYATLDCPIFMINAAGTRTPAAGRGTLTAKFALANGTTSKMSIADVLHVPNLVVNLISGPLLCKQGARIEMEEGRCKFGKDGKMFTIAQLIAKFGHLNMPYLLEMERKETVMGLSIKGEDFDVAKCHGCMQGRGVHTNISKGPASCVNKTLHTIHTNLWGPVRHKSFAGEVMVLGLVNNYLRFQWSFPIGKKSSVTALVVEFIQQVKQSCDCNVAIFHSDNGGEASSTGPQFHIHYQNGVIEQGWCTMFETVRIWLLVSGLLLSFWAFAANAFTYTRLSSVAPNHSNSICVWGCMAYVRIAPEPCASKIEPPRVKAHFIGYAEQGWMFWQPNTNTDLDKADLCEDLPTTLFGNPPTGSLNIDGDDAVKQDFALNGAALAPGGDSRDDTPPPVGQARASDCEYTPAAPGREHIPGDSGRVQYSNGQELAPIFPTHRAPAPVVSNGRAPV
ncbi:BQ5605_C030g10753 [Microbotryum silenes-dioicae]|uniref:BQ5605_C030g10753 protein n=1 Tax=Microbotryum silenes-dioicae TaxID=796604 RepID=A0A2X0NAQ8_9BASI|nr:BQ5605_C030g10753 [Microbotryum silenes-dioicae]